jgi:aspartyl-tRNA(Asn)/glutamyl-tRNA(Gln) amidotransferase subunit A
VAAGLVPVATATDTGGSIRQPASFCGVTGIKPTYGRASRWGMIAFASSLDQAGIMTRSAEDAALVFNAMLGFDPKDSTSINRTEEDFTRLLQQPVKGLRIGLPKEFFASGLPPEVEQPIHAALTQLEQQGAVLVDISLPNIALGIPAYYVIAPAEASSNLSRFDGVRYGHRAEHYQDLIDMMKRSRAEGFGPEPKRRIMIGTYVLSHGYYDAYFLQAQKVRRLIAEDFQAAFEQCDLIAGPNAASEAWNLNAKTSDPVEMYLSDLFTIPGSLAGLPGMSVPCGFAGTTGRPVGLQLMANHFAEAQLLGVAHQYQLATDWHLRRPGGFAE